MALHEMGFNYGLADALRASSVRWTGHDEYVKPEIVRGRMKRPDILIDDPLMGRVVVECEVAGGKDKDAPARLLDEGEDYGVAIAVRFPEAYRRWKHNEVEDRLLAGAKLCYAVYQRDADSSGVARFPKKGWLEGTVADLAALAPWASAPPHKVKSVADGVVDKIVECADILIHEESLHADDVERLAKHVRPSAGDKPLRALAVLWLNAFLVQRHLRRMKGEQCPCLPANADCVDARTVAAGWDHILATNWQSIFERALVALREATQCGAESGQALGALLGAIDIMDRERMGDRVQVGAELFPKLTPDRKESAAFYTTPPAAEMLAAMTIRRSDRNDWMCSDGPPRLADFACGTGTLLRAGLRRIMDFHQAEANSNAQTLGALHQAAMTHQGREASASSGGITGADVSPIAVHLTNSTLAVMGRGEPYQDTNIGWLETGKLPYGAARRKGPGRLTGSLEFLAVNSARDLLGASGKITSGTKRCDAKTVDAMPESMDYMLMNPPYSRTRGGQSAFDIGGMTKVQKDGCQKRWAWLLKQNAKICNLAEVPAYKKAGLAAAFLAIARRMAKPGARIGFVLPLTAAFEPSWAPTRRMVREWFEDVIAVGKAGSTGGKDALSDDTGMGEMMLVATKRSAVAEASPVLCASLHRIPLRMGEAGAVGGAVVEAAKTCADSGRSVVMVGSDEIGSVVRLDGDADAPWSHLGVLHPEISAAALSVAVHGVVRGWGGEGTLPLKCGMTTIGELFDMGPTHHLIGHFPTAKPQNRTGAFVMHEIDAADALGEDRSMWGADCKAQTNLVALPTHKGLPFAGASDGERNRIRGMRGTLFYARNLRWTSQALLAARTEKLLHGGRAWLALRHADEAVLCAMALWFNSTLGMMVHWSQAGRQQLGRAGTQLGAINRMPCPDANKLTKAQVGKAAKWFDHMKAKDLHPGNKADEDCVRALLDEAVADVFGLSSEALQVIADWRRLWVAEPTVRG